MKMPNMKIKITIALVLAATFLLNDLYYAGVGRAFDYLAIAVLLHFFILSGSKLYYGSKAMIFSFVLAPWLFFGALFNGAFVAAMAMLVGSLMFFRFFFAICQAGYREVVETSVSFIVIATSVMLALQAIIFFFSGHYIDFPQLFGSYDSRSLNEGIGYFRFSGLFQEPNAYCVSTFCLLSTRIFNKHRDVWVEIFAMITMAISQSLWGFAAIFILMFSIYDFRRLYLVIVGALIFVVLIIYFSGADVGQILDDSRTIYRITNLDNDASRQARVGSIDNFDFDIFLLLGHGLDTEQFQTVGANGIAFILYSFGIAGAIMLAVAVVYLARANFKVLLLLFFSLTTFPMFSYMFYWCFLGIMLGSLNVRPQSKVPKGERCDLVRPNAGAVGSNAVEMTTIPAVL